jgi:DNA adenine methylase
MAKTFQPIIKWTGSKRSQCRDIVSYFPKEIDTYYEPFCGGASVMRALIEDKTINVNKYIISDINQDLMNLWNIIKDTPEQLFMYYSGLWKTLNKDNATIDYQKRIYETIRKQFNSNHNPMDFFFLLRTCFNGMVRYNTDGEFNTSFHINRPGINPDKLKPILYEWSNLINQNNIEFKCCNYTDINPTENDFVYLDPPYAKTKGLYNGGLNLEELYSYMLNLKSSYILSFDGISGDNNQTVDLPVELFDKHIYLNSGNSSFKRIVESNNKAQVYESLYIKIK